MQRLTCNLEVLTEWVTTHEFDSDITRISLLADLRRVNQAESLILKQSMLHELWVNAKIYAISERFNCPTYLIRERYTRLKLSAWDECFKFALKNFPMLETEGSFFAKDVLVSLYALSFEDTKQIRLRLIDAVTAYRRYENEKTS